MIMTLFGTELTFLCADSRYVELCVLLARELCASYYYCVRYKRVDYVAETVWALSLTDQSGCVGGAACTYYWCVDQKHTAREHYTRAHEYSQTREDAS
jgi:hypothetical protein